MCSLFPIKISQYIFALTIFPIKKYMFNSICVNLYRHTLSTIDAHSFAHRNLSFLLSATILERERYSLFDTPALVYSQRRMRRLVSVSLTEGSLVVIRSRVLQGRRKEKRKSESNTRWFPCSTSDARARSRFESRRRTCLLVRARLLSAPADDYM